MRAVIAVSYERIHRANLIGMGILPLAFAAGTSAEALGLDGTETYRLTGIDDAIASGAMVSARATAGDGRDVSFPRTLVVFTAAERGQLRQGGILAGSRRRFA